MQNRVAPLKSKFSILIKNQVLIILMIIMGGGTSVVLPKAKAAVPEAGHGIRRAGQASTPGVIKTKTKNFLGTWSEQGVYSRSSISKKWIKLASPATDITAGDLDGDGIDDLIGIWPGHAGVWVKYSSSGAWTRLSTTASWIAAGDMNGDGRPDFVGNWANKGVYFRDSSSRSWTKIAAPATQITAGDLDRDGVDDLIGIWPNYEGVWVKYSSSKTWASLSTTADWIAAGDVNGDNHVEFIGTWSGQGVYYKDLARGSWVKLASAATRIAAGDLDGDGTDDLIGIWPAQGGVWVRYSKTNTWAKLSSTADSLAAGKMIAPSASSRKFYEIRAPVGGKILGEDIEEKNFVDLSGKGPGGGKFIFQKQENLIPGEGRVQEGRETPREQGKTPREGRPRFRWFGINEILLVVILLGFFLGFKFLFKTYWNPLSLGSLIWFFSVLCSVVGPVQFPPLTSKTVVFIATSFLALLSGALMQFYAGAKGPARVQKDGHPAGIDQKRVFQAILGLSLLGSFAPPLMVYHLHKTGNLNLLWDIKGHLSLRILTLPSAGPMQYPLLSSLFLSLNIAALVLAGLFFVSSAKLKKYIFFWPLANITIAGLILQGRALLVWGLMVFISSLIFAKAFFKKEKLKLNAKYAVSLLLIVAILILIRVWKLGSFKGDELLMGSQYEHLLRWGVNTPGFYSALSFYDYFCSPVRALSEFLEKGRPEMSWGAYTFKPFFKYFLRQDSSLYYAGVPPLGFNVFSYLREIYVDFGFLGLIFFNLILGFLAAFCFFKSKEKTTLVYHVLLSFLTTFLLFSIWIPLTSVTTFWSSLLISGVIGLLIPRKHNDEQRTR